LIHVFEEIYDVEVLVIRQGKEADVKPNNEKQLILYLVD